MTRPAASPGFVARLIQVALVLVVAYWFAFAVLTDRLDFAYDLRAVSIFFQVSSSAVCPWLLQRRARAARTVIPVCMAGSAALAIAMMATGSPWTVGRDPVAPLPPVPCTAVVALSLAVAAYLRFSPRMAETLDRSLARTSEERKRDLAAARLADQHGSGMATRPWQAWQWWRNLLIHFCAFTLLGHWAEIGFCTLIRLGIVSGGYDPTNKMLWEEWLYPFLAEGYAIVFIVVLLHPLKEWLLNRFGGRRLPAIVMSFLANALVCTSIDFLTGITANADHHLWDYSDLPFNFMGQICLQNSLIYSTAATLIVWTIYPAMERLVRRPSNAMMDVTFAGVFSLWVFLFLMYLVYLGPQGLVLG